jgi:putative transposase
LHKVSTRLIRENQTIILEDLNVQGMLKNHKLARSISDASWSTFVQYLKYKSEWYGKNLLFIGRFEPSSKMCSCGVLNKSLQLSDREWTCDNCKTVHDRDILAAQNIKRFGLQEQNLINTGADCAGERREPALC